MSQNARPGEMNPADRQKFEAGMTATANKAAHGAEHSGEHGAGEHNKTEERAPAQSDAPRPGAPSGSNEAGKTGGHN